MKKAILFIAALLTIGLPAMAQKKKEKTDLSNRTLTGTLVLKIDREGGANGASVAWHPVLKRYYAAMAGNVNFPMEVFDQKGVMLSDDKLETMFDVRGLWYNTERKTLQANGYDDFGWGEYKLDSKGMPTEIVKMSFTTTQPSPQSVGAYDAKNNVVYFWDYTSKGVERHNAKNGINEATIKLHPGARKAEDIAEIEKKEVKEEYNDNGVIYTGITNAEIGILNITSRQIELYNIATGFMTQELKLPDDAKTEEALNFSYSNGIFWLFDKKLRIWQGYK